MTEAARIIQQSRPDFTPRVAIVLGSGLSSLAGQVADPMALSYARLPGFPAVGVEGHEGRLVLGWIAKTPVAMMQGREHFYEHGRADVMKPAIRTLRALGAEILIVTNAAGSLDPAMGPGSVMLIGDHINLVQASPLTGENGNNRFVDMVGAYDSDLALRARAAALALNIRLHDGVYVWVSGPQFETPAEIRMAAMIGGTAIGMSTVPEVILARHGGMRVAGFSIITNLAAGMGAKGLSHEHTMRNAVEAAEKLRLLLTRLIEGLAP